MVACEQALRGTLAAGHEKEGQLATRSPEFANLQQKRLCEMQNGRDDNSNAIITLGLCFSMSVYIRNRFCFMLIGGNLTAQSPGSLFSQARNMHDDMDNNTSTK